MARIRNILVENTLGKVFTNIATIADSDSSKIIAGQKLQTKTINPTSPTTIVRVTNNLGGTGIYFPTDSLITTVTMNFATAPNSIVANTSIRFKTGTTYATATTVNTTTIVKTVSSTITTLNTTILAGQYLFVDVASAAATGSGFGLTILANYYGN